MFKRLAIEYLGVGHVLLPVFFLGPVELNAQAMTVVKRPYPLYIIRPWTFNNIKILPILPHHGLGTPWEMSSRGKSITSWNLFDYPVDVCGFNHERYLVRMQCPESTSNRIKSHRPRSSPVYESLYYVIYTWRD